MAGQHSADGKRHAAGGAGQQRAGAAVGASAAAGARPSTGAAAGGGSRSRWTTCITAARQNERNVILRALDKNGYSRARAASRAGHQPGHAVQEDEEVRPDADADGAERFVTARTLPNLVYSCLDDCRARLVPL